LTGQSPQRAVAATDEEEEHEDMKYHMSSDSFKISLQIYIEVHVKF
jgi:hypothetical protein